MNTELTTTQSNTALTTQDEYIPVAGLDQLDPGEFTLPTLKLTQAQSTQDKADEHLGQWYRRDTGEYLSAPAVLILGIAKSRVLFPPTYEGAKSEPLCKSDDAVKPRPEFFNSTPAGFSVTIGDSCADCILSQWGENGEPPACTISENWAALTASGDPVVIRLARSSAKASAQLKNMARAAKLKRKPLYIKLDSRKEVNDKGMKYYVPDVKAAGEPTAELLEMAAAFTGLNLAARAAAMDDHGDDGGQVSADNPPADIDLPF